MKHIKRFNQINEEYTEEYTGDKTDDYSQWRTPITKEFILETLTKEYLEYEEYELTEQVKQDLDRLADRTLYQFHDQLAYTSENFEGQFEEIAGGTYK